MSLFLLASPTLAFFIILSTGFSDAIKDSLRLFLQGLAASTLALALVYLSRYLIPDTPGSFLGLLHHWYYEFFCYLAVGITVFTLVPAYRQGYADRGRRLLSFLFGTMAPAGFATLLAVDYIRDPYYLFMLPLLRIAVLVLVSRAVHAAIGEFGVRLALLVLAALSLSFLPALSALFQFWNMRLLALLFFSLSIGSAIFFFRGILEHTLRQEIRAFKEGL